MEELPSIPDAEIENDIDFIKQITTVATSILLIALAWYSWQIITGEITA